MNKPQRLLLPLAAACGIFTATPAQAFDFGFHYDGGYRSFHHHHSHHSCYDRTVAWAQCILRDLGYYCGCVDGIMGPRTRSALIRYQCDHGLPHTGCLDSRTLCMLRSE